MAEGGLIAMATALAGEFRTSADCVAGGVAAAILSRSGRVYTGVCVDTQCGMGFSAEHAAVAEMLKARESEIALVVAVNAAGVRSRLFRLSLLPARQRAFGRFRRRPDGVGEG